jgi:hypothetical protein
VTHSSHSSGLKAPKSSCEFQNKVQLLLLHHPQLRGEMERGGRRKRPCFPGYSKQFLRCDKRNSDRPSSSAEVWRNVARNARPETACPRSNTRLPCIQAASLNSSTQNTAFFSLHTFPVPGKNRESRGRVPGGPGFESRSGDRIMIEVHIPVLSILHDRMCITKDRIMW